MAFPIALLMLQVLSALYSCRAQVLDADTLQNIMNGGSVGESHIPATTQQSTLDVNIGAQLPPANIPSFLPQVNIPSFDSSLHLSSGTSAPPAHIPLINPPAHIPSITPSAHIPSITPPAHIPSITPSAHIPSNTSPIQFPSNTPPAHIPPHISPVYTSTTVNPTPASKGDCSDGLFARHEKNCSDFYRCLPNGGRVKFTCGPYQYFDLSISGCNYKYLVKC